jgi:hypothetical protein
MNEVIDAKIVRILYIESCAECPYLGWSGSILYGEDTQTNSEYRYCAKCMREEMRSSLECDVGDCADNGSFWSKCPLPQAMCVTTEEVQE